ncbi:hypothetical protein AB0J63_26350 [Streptosporangium canum]|uniref:hypothetical protein n=1 Tax=Streptosporangium canum TaxID=324952 RepID=UPI00342CA427
MNAYRLYTSKEAAERAGGGLSASFFDRLAASRQVEHTYAARKIRWTDAQIAAAIAYHARGGTPSSAPQPVAPPARPPHVPGAVTPLRAKPGKRYAERMDRPATTLRARPEAARSYGKQVAP